MLAPLYKFMTIQQKRSVTRGVRYGFIKIRMKVVNLIKKIFIKNHFDQNHFHQNFSSKNHFHQKTNFIKKPLSSKTTFIKNHFHQNPLSSKTIFIKNHFLSEGPTTRANNIVRVCVKASRAEGPRRLHTNTACAHLWGLNRPFC